MDDARKTFIEGSIASRFGLRAELVGGGDTYFNSISSINRSVEVTFIHACPPDGCRREHQELT